MKRFSYILPRYKVIFSLHFIRFCTFSGDELPWPLLSHPFTFANGKNRFILGVKRAVTCICRNLSALRFHSITTGVVTFIRDNNSRNELDKTGRGKDCRYC